MRFRSAGDGNGMTDEEIAELKRKLDLPEPVLEFLRHQPRWDSVTVGFVVVAFSVLAALLLFVPIGALYLYNIGRMLVDAGYLPHDTLLFDQDLMTFAVPLVIGGIGGALMAYLLFRLCTRLSPSLYYRTIASGLHPTTRNRRGSAMPKFRGGVLAFTRSMLDGINRNLHPKEYLKRYESRKTALLALSVLLLYLLAAGLFTLNITSLTRVTPRGVGVSLDFANGIAHYEWRDIVGIETGCSTIHRVGGRYSVASTDHIVKYSLQLNDDRKIDVGTYNPLGRTWLDALETIDSKLAELNVPKSKGDFDRKCIAAKRRQFGRWGFERLERVLRGDAA